MFQDSPQRLPKIRRKFSYLLPKAAIHPLHPLHSVPLTNSEANLFKELPQVPRAINFEEVYEFNSSLILIPNMRLQTSSLKMRNSVTLVTRRESSIDTSQDLSIEGVASPTYRKIFKKPEFVIPVLKPKMPAIRKLAKPVVHNESSVKEIMFWNWINVFKSSNGFEVFPHKAHFKYFVGKGNNGSLVNQVLKTRFWWSKVETPEEANFVWTQIKHKPSLDAVQGFGERLERDGIRGFDIKLPKAVLLANQEALGFKGILASRDYVSMKKQYFLQAENTKLHNRLSNNSSICNKKEMFRNMKKFYDESGLNVFEIIPLTFHVESGASDPQFVSFASQFEEGSIWIVKPGECTNRGKGIKVSSSLSEIKSLISRNTENRTYIIQRYLANPLLINKRKFDIRCFTLITTFADHVQGYFFKEGYLRTSCKEFNIKNTKDKYIHLTNDAVQKDHEDYGKYESGNKLSYYDFQKFLNLNHPNQDFFMHMYPQIVEIVKSSISSVYKIINDEDKLHSFEVLGYDFMIDSDFKVWLIEINTNPCLELSSSYLSKIIPEMLDNSFRIALDPLFPPPETHKKFKNWAKNVNLNNKYQLVFSSLAGDL